MTADESQRLTVLEVQMEHMGATLDKIAATVSAMHDTLTRQQGAEVVRHRMVSRAYAALALVASLVGGSIVTAFARKLGFGN